MPPELDGSSRSFGRDRFNQPDSNAPSPQAQPAVTPRPDQATHTFSIPSQDPSPVPHAEPRSAIKPSPQSAAVSTHVAAILAATAADLSDRNESGLLPDHPIGHAIYAFSRHAAARTALLNLHPDEAHRLTALAAHLIHQYTANLEISVADMNFQAMAGLISAIANDITNRR